MTASSSVECVETAAAPPLLAEAVARAEGAQAALPLALAERTPGLRAEFVRYFGCSAVGLASDLLVFHALLSLGCAWSLAAAAGFMVGLALVYTLSVRLVFAHRRVRDARAEFAVFAAIGLFGLLLTEALLWLLHAQLQWPPLVAKLASAGVVFMSNFGLRKAVLFTHGQRTP